MAIFSTALKLLMSCLVSSSVAPVFCSFSNARDGNEGDSVLLSGYPLSSSGAATYSTYLKHYYDNLTSNFGMNYDSSCGYVAMGMLLSYYDSYFDGNLVASNFDVTSQDSSENLIERRCSPGILHDDFTTTGFYSIYGDSYPGANLYLTYAMLIHQQSLQARLIEIGNTLGYVNVSSSQAFGTTMEQRKSILDYYLQNDVGLTISDYSITYYGYSPSYYDGLQTYLANIIKNYFDIGHPVLVGISQPGLLTSTNHAVIAYDYDFDVNTSALTLYYHSGLSHYGYTTHMTLSQMSYSLIKSYMVIDFNYTATPGCNYGLTQGESTNFYPYNSNLLNWQSLGEN